MYYGGEQLNCVALKMEFGQENRLHTDRMMRQCAGEPEYAKCFFHWIPFNPIFLALEFNKSRIC